MEEVYDLHQYSHMMVLYMQKTVIEFRYYSTITRNADIDQGITVKDTCITYDKRKMKIKNWGKKYFESDYKDDLRIRNKLYRTIKRYKKKWNQNGVHIDDFKDKLYQIFKKDKDKWDQDDLFLLKAVSDFIRLSVEELVKKSKGQLKGADQLHYVFLVPSEWEEDIRETLLRPIFIQSNLISKNDHNDRLLFCSDLESIFYNLMQFNAFDFKKRSKTILCRFYPISESEILITLDLVSTVNYLFDFPDSLFYPHVERSNSLSLTINTFTDGIKAFIKDKLPLSIQEEILQIIIDSSDYPSYAQFDIRDKDYDLMKPLITDTDKWELDKHQKDFMKSICIFDICSEVRKNLTNNIDDLLANDIIKEHNISSLIIPLSSEKLKNINLLNWSEYLLTYNRTYSRNENIIFTRQSYTKETPSYQTIKGANIYGEDAISNADIYSRPRILSVKNLPTSSSVFRESKPNAIININILTESTTLSYSLLDEEGFIEKVWNHNDFLIDKNLRSLGSFFCFLETTTLNVKSSFTKFAKDYLTGDASFFSGDKNNALLQLNASKIEVILCNDSYTEDILVSTRQQIYIDIFLLLYTTYIKYAISSKLPDIIGSNKKIKIGYNITVEKVLLNRLFGTKEGLKDIIYSSGLIQKADDSKKLRITTQGERILHLLQRSLALLFPLKSYFVIAQLHENYIQLTLNQVVTESNSSEEDQEVIIIRDRIIHIPNIYTSLCLNMWNNIVEDIGLIKLCDIHREKSGDDLLEILSLKNQAQFVKNFKQYISQDNLGNNSSQPTTDEIIIQLGVSCNCRVHLTAHDVMEISFQPVLQDIASIVSASFINKELFGKFWNIQYFLQLIRFDHSTRLHDPIIKMLKETTEDVMIEQGVDIQHYIIPKSLNQLLQPVLHQQSISYKEFQVGTLHHVYGDRYGFGFYIADGGAEIKYKSKKTDTKAITIKEKTVIPFLNEGDIINDSPANLTFYLNSSKSLSDIDIYIRFYKLKMSYGLNTDGTAFFEDIQEDIYGTHFDGFPEDLEVGQDIPIAISILYEAYLGMLTFRAKLVGQNTNINKQQRLGTPMHLSRF